MFEKEWAVERLHIVRSARFRQVPARSVKNEKDALEFIDDVGICLLFSAKNVLLPTMWGAICGADRPIPHNHEDPGLNLAWEWKDSIPARKEALYGKFLMGKPVFISLELAPAFYAMSDNDGRLDDYLERYQAGRMSEEAKRVYEVLLAEGAQPTSELRRKARISGKSAAGIFDRALAELQMDFLIVKVGTADTNRWKYCYVYDLFVRRFPDLVEAGCSIPQDKAAGVLLLRYLRTVVLCRSAEAARVLGWDSWRLERTVRQLEEQGTLISDARIIGQAGSYLASLDLRE